LGKPYQLDIGMNRLEVAIEDSNDFWYSSRIIDQGDLSTYYGYETFDASGYTIRQGKVYPELVKSIGESREIVKNPLALLKKGYTYVRMEKISNTMLSNPSPIHLISTAYEVPELNLEVGINPTFLLEKDGELVYAVVNGFLIDLNSGAKRMVFDWSFKNAMIFR
ncbi:peptidase M14, partial [Maribacter sp.]|nr:peptidase M14 [Maribacter sp.]